MIVLRRHDGGLCPVLVYMRVESEFLGGHSGAGIRGLKGRVMGGAISSVTMQIIDRM